MRAQLVNHINCLRLKELIKIIKKAVRLDLRSREGTWHPFQYLVPPPPFHHMFIFLKTGGPTPPSFLAYFKTYFRPKYIYLSSRCHPFPPFTRRKLPWRPALPPLSHPVSLTSSAPCPPTPTPPFSLYCPPFSFLVPLPCRLPLLPLISWIVLDLETLN